MSLTILFIGPSGLGTTSRHRATALERLGHKVFIFDPLVECSYHSRNRYLYYLHLRTGFRFFQPAIREAFKKWIREREHEFSIVFVNSGEWIGRRFAQELRQLGALVLYVNDDPTGGRDGRRFDTLKSAL